MPPEEQLNTLQTAHEVLKTEIKGELREINNKLDVILSGQGGNCVKHSARVQALEDQVNTMQNNISWLWKSFLGAIVSAAAMLIFSKIINN